MYKLNKKDKKILETIDLNARIPISEIARKIRLSKEVVNYRLKNLEKRGVIEGYYPIIDISKTGIINCRILIKFERITPQIEKEFIEFTKKIKPVTWIAVLEGEYDIAIVFQVKNTFELHEAMQKIYEKYINYIKKRSISIVNNIYHFQHKYLYGNRETPCIITGTSKVANLDKQDMKILNILSSNCRTTLVEIAKLCKLSANAVKARIKNLEKKKIIIGYNFKLNNRTLEYTHRKTYVYFYNYSKKQLTKLITYLQNQPNVIYITKAIGSSDLEFETMFKVEKKYKEFLDRLRTEFKEFIREHSTLTTSYEPLVRYISK